MAAVVPGARGGGAHNQSEIREILNRTKCWAVYKWYIACVISQNVHILNSRQGTPVATVRYALEEEGEKVQRCAFYKREIFIATNRRIRAMTLDDGEKAPFVPERADLEGVTHFFAADGYLVVGSATLFETWNLESRDHREIRVSSAAEKAFLFNRELVVTYADSPVFHKIHVGERQREPKREEQRLQTPGVFGNGHFLAYCDSPHSIFLKTTLSGDLSEMLPPFTPPLLGIELSETHMVAVGKNTLTVCHFPSKTTQSTTKQGICGVRSDGSHFYILYDHSVTRLDPRTREEELLFSGENCGEIQRICQVGEATYIYDIGGVAHVWPQEKRSKSCCIIL